MLGKEEIVSPSLDELKEHYHHILTLLGEDPEREGLLKTPERVAKAMLALTKGYSMDPHEVLRSAKFKEDYNQMVIVKDIDFFSMCEHHMLPFYGKAHVAYIPNGYITGLSKIARVVGLLFATLGQPQKPAVYLLCNNWAHLIDITYNGFGNDEMLCTRFPIKLSFALDGVFSIFQQQIGFGSG